MELEQQAILQILLQLSNTYIFIFYFQLFKTAFIFLFYAIWTAD